MVAPVHTTLRPKREVRPPDSAMAPVVRSPGNPQKKKPGKCGGFVFFAGPPARVPLLPCGPCLLRAGGPPLCLRSPQQSREPARCGPGGGRSPRPPPLVHPTACGHRIVPTRGGLSRPVLSARSASDHRSLHSGPLEPRWGGSSSSPLAAPLRCSPSALAPARAGARGCPPPPAACTPF